MKKFIACAIGLLIGSWALAAQDVSIGFGVALSPEANILQGTGGGGLTGKNTYQPTFVSTAFILDATYIRASIGLAFFVSGTYEDNNFVAPGTYRENVHFDWNYIPITVMFKYPFVLNNRLSLYPTIGLEYDINLTYTDTDSGIGKRSLSSEQRDDLDHFYIKGGIGADIYLSGNMYLSPEVLFAYKFRSTYDKNTIDYYESLGYTDVSLDTVKVDLGIALLFKL